MKLKPEFTIEKRKKGEKKSSDDNKKKKRKRSQSSGDRAETKKKTKNKEKPQKPKENKSKEKNSKKQPKKQPNSKQKNKKKETKKEIVPTATPRGRSRKRKTSATTDDDSTSLRSTSRNSRRDASVITVSSRESSLSGVNRPWAKKKKQPEPIVYSCAGFCSLGAGSLLTGLIYIGLCVGFLVYRIGDFNEHLGKRKILWEGKSLFIDIWKILLIFGMGTAGISMLAALVLLVASCIWGHKEHYKRMRNSVIIWVCATAFAMIGNIGEAVYATAIPDKIPKEREWNQLSVVEDFHDHSGIKDNMVTIWALTGVHAVLYFYLLIVLISYLRLLKYKSAPKVGTNPGVEDDESTQGSLPGSLSKGSSYIEKARQRTPLPGARSKLPTSRSAPSFYTERSLGSRTQSQSTDAAKSFRTAESSYINWPLHDGTYLQDSTFDLTANECPTNEDAQTVASSIYDEPPTNVYDETPLENEVPAQSKINRSSLPSTASSLYQIENQSQSAAIAKELENKMPKQKELPLVPGQGTAEPSSSRTQTKPTALMSEEISPARRPKGNSVAQREPYKPQLAPEAVSSFFQRLNEQQMGPFVQEQVNPVEEMFRLFGGDLCTKHPENVDRYLKSYKDLRSKTSHITSMRDPYDFDNLRKTANVAPDAYPMDAGQYSMSSSSYYGDYGGMKFPPRHQQPMTKARPEPVYGFRPKSRDSDFPMPHPSNRHRDMRPPLYPDPYSFAPHGFNPNDSIYYDQDCSTCYGDFVYDDYGSYYSHYNDFYPPPPPMEPPPVYTPTPSRHPYDPSTKQFSARSDARGTRSKQPETTWFPVDASDNYSTYMPNDNYSLSSRCRSMPNLAAASRSAHRYPSVLSDEVDFRKPVAPDVTIPCPREAQKMSRSSSWSNSAGKRSSQQMERVPSSGMERSNSMRNYSGYHSGDLRGRTSHTSDARDDVRPPERLSQSTSRRSSFSRQQRRPSGVPQIPPRVMASENYEELGSVYSDFDLASSPTGRPEMRPRGSNSRLSNASTPSTFVPNKHGSTEAQRGLRRSAASHDPSKISSHSHNSYPDRNAWPFEEARLASKSRTSSIDDPRGRRSNDRGSEIWGRREERDRSREETWGNRGDRGRSKERKWRGPPSGGPYDEDDFDAQMRGTEEWSSRRGRSSSRGRERNNERSVSRGRRSRGEDSVSMERMSIRRENSDFDDMFTRKRGRSQSQESRPATIISERTPSRSHSVERSSFRQGARDNGRRRCHSQEAIPALPPREIENEIPFQRSKSFRFADDRQSSRQSGKQVKFGSSPNLRQSLR